MPLSGSPLERSIDLRNVLGRGLENKPDDVAVVSVESRWTWHELNRTSTRYAANLLGLGLRAGDRVASLMPNRTALLVHYLGCLKAGLVTVPLNYRYMPPEIDHALEVSGASILLAHAERDQDVAASRLASRLPLGVVRYGARDDRSPSFEELIDREPLADMLATPGLSAPAVIFFTSGSTGPAKGVTHTFETLGWITASIIKSMEITSDDVFLPGSSFSHVGGFGFSLTALAAGARVVVPRTSDGDELLPLLREHRPTVLSMLPVALFALVRDHDATRADFASLRLCRAGGDKVAAELEQELNDLTGLVIDEGYGMTETGLIACNPPSGPIKLGSVGPVNPGYTVSIRDGQGDEVATGEEGNVWVSSPCRTAGYWNDPVATEGAVRDGWFDTGDVVRADGDGYLWFRGRRKQIIVHDGSNISPQEVEDALLAHPAVAGAGVVGIHDLVHGENVRAYVALRDGAERPTSQELIRFARARVGYKSPEEIVVLDDMPLNATGKVDRVSLKRMAQDRAAV